MSETETLEQNIDLTETFPEAVAELQSELEDKIDYALNLGVFTEAEAKAWRAGFEACQKLEHMDGLVEIIDKFIASGEAVVSELQSTLDTELLTADEKTAAEWQAEMLCYQDKLQLISDLRITIKQVKHYKQQLLRVLQVSKLLPAESEVWLRQFAETDTFHKEGLIAKVAQRGIEINARYPIVQSRIMELLQNSQFSEARAYLNNSQLGSAEYEQLTHKIDLSEATHFRTLALSV